MIDLVVFDMVAHVRNSGGVFLLVYSIRHLLLVDGLTQSGKHTADAHRPENGLGGGLSIDFTDEVEVAEGCEMR